MLRPQKPVCWLSDVFEWTINRCLTIISGIFGLNRSSIEQGIRYSCYPLVVVFNILSWYRFHCRGMTKHLTWTYLDYKCLPTHWLGCTPFVHAISSYHVELSEAFGTRKIHSLSSYSQNRHEYLILLVHKIHKPTAAGAFKPSTPISKRKPCRLSMGNKWVWLPEHGVPCRAYTWLAIVWYSKS